MTEMTDRLEAIRKYHQQQSMVKVEMPPTFSKTTKGTVTIRFNGKRCGYTFKDGVAWVHRKDLYKLTDLYANLIITEGELQ